MTRQQGPRWTLLEHLLQLPKRYADVRIMEVEQEKGVDVAREPVDLNTAAEFMDTGVLHEKRMCVQCGEQPAAKGKNVCKDCGRE